MEAGCLKQKRFQTISFSWIEGAIIIAAQFNPLLVFLLP